MQFDKVCACLKFEIASPYGVGAWALCVCVALRRWGWRARACACARLRESLCAHVGVSARPWPWGGLAPSRQGVELRAWRVARVCARGLLSRLFLRAGLMLCGHASAARRLLCSFASYWWACKELGGLTSPWLLSARAMVFETQASCNAAEGRPTLARDI